MLFYIHIRVPGQDEGVERIKRTLGVTGRISANIWKQLFKTLAGIPLIHNRMKTSFRSSVFQTNMTSVQTCLTAHMQCIKYNNKANQRGLPQIFLLHRPDHNIFPTPTNVSNDVSVAGSCNDIFLKKPTTTAGFVSY